MAGLRLVSCPSLCSQPFFICAIRGVFLSYPPPSLFGLVMLLTTSHPLVRFLGLSLDCRDPQFFFRKRARRLRGVGFRFPLCFHRNFAFPRSARKRYKKGQTLWDFFYGPLCRINFAVRELSFLVKYCFAALLGRTALISAVCRQKRSFCRVGPHIVDLRPFLAFVVRQRSTRGVFPAVFERSLFFGVRIRNERRCI